MTDQSAPTEHRAESRLALAMAAAVIVGLVASGLLVWRGTEAAFTASTGNEANSWTAGSVTLTDDDGGAGVMFDLSGLLPGDTGSHCITVNYTGDVATNGVKLYATSPSDPDLLAQYVTLQVEEGDAASGGSFGSCTGFVPGGGPIFNGALSTFTADNYDYGNSVGSWTPTAADSRVYQFTWTLSAATPGAMQGAATSTTFTWEAQAGS